MQYKYILLALAAEQLAMTAAAPSADHARSIEKRSFRVDRVAIPGQPKNVLKSMKKAIAKYGGTVPDGLAKADEAAWEAPRVHKAAAPAAGAGTGAGAAGAGAGAATPPATTPAATPTPGAGGKQVGNVANHGVEGEVEFVSPITVGGQKINMDFDTGSSDLWLFSTQLAAAQQKGHTVFDPTKSQTFKAEAGNSFSINFGDGSAASGKTVGTDTVTIGGATAQSQVVELADKVSGSFVADTNSNGLVGLAFSSINTVKPKKATTFLDTIHADLEQPILAANLRHNAVGSYEFGAIDTKAFTGNLQFTAVDNSQGFWQFGSAKFQIGTGQVQANPKASPAIADTGTTLMLVDDAVAQAYYATVQGAKQDPQTGMFVFPCNAKLNDLTVAMGPTIMATIPGSLINFQPLSGAGAAKKHKKRSGKAGKRAAAAASAGLCAGGVQGSQGQPIQIYGDIMFKAQYTVFNIGNNTIGFAPHA